jgi:hypothetical protein
VLGCRSKDGESPTGGPFHDRRKPIIVRAEEGVVRGGWSVERVLMRMNALHMVASFPFLRDSNEKGRLMARARM